MSAIRSLSGAKRTLSKPHTMIVSIYEARRFAKAAAQRRNKELSFG